MNESRRIPLSQAEREIPRGSYCYQLRGRAHGDPDTGAVTLRTRVCPYWSRDPNRPPQENGYCQFLGEGDWMAPGVSLLWDQVKECGINLDEQGEDE